MSAHNSDTNNNNSGGEEDDDPKDDDCGHEEEDDDEEDDGRTRSGDGNEREEEEDEETNNNKESNVDRDFDLIEAEAVLNVQNLGMTDETDLETTIPMERSRSRDPPVFSSSYSHGNLHVYKCSECNYETYNLAALTSHQKTHKLYQCDVCQMKFSHSANMRRHRMRHTGYKPFECQVCHKRFFRKDHMTEHMVTHSKQLQLHCPLCDKTFHRQVYFKAHLQAEHWNVPGEKVCRICGHKAATMKGAKLHYTTRHANPIITLDYESESNRNIKNDSSPDSSHNMASSAAAVVSIGNMVFPTNSASDYGLTTSLSGSLDESRMVSLLDGSRNNNGIRMMSNPRSLLAPRRSMTNAVSLQRVSGRQLRSNGRSETDNVTIKVEMPDETTMTDENGRENGEFLLDRIRNSMPTQSYDTTNEPQRAPSSSLPSLVNNHSHSNTCSPNSTLDVIRVTNSPSAAATAAAAAAAANSVAAFATVSSVLNRQLNLGDLSITPVGGILVCVHCGIVFPDQTLYFLHKGVHSENNPWKCNICGELCRDKYDFNTHILSKAHQ